MKIAALFLALAPTMAFSQQVSDDDSFWDRIEQIPIDSLCLDVRTSNFPTIGKLQFAQLPGQVQLTQPMRIDGTMREMRTEEHGLAYPTLYDWNHDGLQDLLMGEFLTGQSRIKVYLNVGTKKKPKFTGEWFYATDKHGDVISNYEWCCIGIHPQVCDLNNDGILDLFSGQYFPGTITWWKGTPEGFEPGQKIPQLGWQEEKRFPNFGDEPDWSYESHNYWNYSSCRLADMNGDGLLDLWVGGCGGYRVALNDGTADEPHFGRREFLYQVDGTILHTWRDPKVQVAPGKFFHAVSVCSGTAHCYLNPFDWDGDGIMDIFITDELTRQREQGVYFAHGVMTDDGIRYEAPVPLFTLASDPSAKALPGCTPHVQVVDYNADGVPDLMMGLSVPTIFGFEGCTSLYDKYISDMRLESPGKDCGETLQYRGGMERIKAEMKDEQARVYIIGVGGRVEYLTLRHRGFPFVFLGKKSGKKQPTADAKPIHAEPREFEYDHPYIYEGFIKESLTRRQPVEIMTRVRSYQHEYEYHVSISTKGTYHLYTASAVNRDMQPLRIEVELPEGVTNLGEMKCPPAIMVGGNECYDGKELHFKQELQVDPSMPAGEYPVKFRISYQTCNDEMCLPPTEETYEEMLRVE